MKKYLFLLLLFCANIALGQTNIARPDSLSKYKLDELLSTGKYDAYPMDLNEDGVEDMLVSSARNCGDELYFFLKGEDEHYHCALKSWNFTMDGTRVIENIVKEDVHIVIDTYFPDKGTYPSYYYIKYDGGRWILDYAVYEYYNGQEDYTRTIVCTIAQDIDMSLISRTDDMKYLNVEPNDMYSNKDCKLSYSVTDLDEFKYRFFDNPYGDLRTVKSVERYRQLLEKIPLTNSNVELYNEIAEQAVEYELYDEAIYLLEHIIAQFPDCTIAYLNLGDAYWGKGQGSDAEAAYKRYLSLMKTQNLDMDRVPERVYTRTK